MQQWNSINVNDFIYESVGDTIKISGYKGNEENVIIPIEIYGKPVVHIERLYSSSIKNIIMPNTVKFILPSAFQNCPNLESISLSENLLLISDCAFKGTKLKNIHLPETLEYIGEDAFKDTPVYDVQKDGIKYIENWAVGINDNNKIVQLKAETIGISDFAFANNYNIEKIIMNDGLKYVNAGAFCNCCKLKNVEFPKRTTLKMSNGVFSFCYALENITIPDNVLEIGEDFFSQCTSLKTVHLSNNIKDILDGCFNNCYKLESVETPEKLQYISFFAFKNCTSLKTLKIPDTVKLIAPNAIPDNISIVGQKDSEAEKYALQNNNKFVVDNKKENDMWNKFKKNNSRTTYDERI